MEIRTLMLFVSPGFRNRTRLGSCFGRYWLHLGRYYLVLYVHYVVCTHLCRLAHVTRVEITEHGHAFDSTH